MKKIVIPIALAMALICGCEESQQQTAKSLKGQTVNESVFAARRIKIIGLTEFKDEDTLHVYIDLLDEFGDRIKTPMKLRFELYDYVPRSSEPKGKRYIIWPDIVLIEPQVNNQYWRDYLRSYEFELDTDMEIVHGRAYILEAVCFTEQGKRLTDTRKLILPEGKGAK